MIKRIEKKKPLCLFFIILLLGPIFTPCATGDETINSEEIDRIFPSKNIERWAVIIGVGNYSETFILPTRLNTTAQNLYDTLRENDWKQSNMRLLLNENATKTAIIDSIRWLDSMEEQNDAVLFYFGGHGACGLTSSIMDEGDLLDEYICPYDTTGIDRSNDIQDKELNKELDKLESQNVVIIFDTCHSGGLYEPSEKKNKNGFTEDFIKDVEGDNRVVIMSCRERQLTWEKENGSIFGRFLVEALTTKKSDKNADNIISAEEAFNYARKKTIVFELKDIFPRKFISFFVLSNLFVFLRMKKNISIIVPFVAALYYAVQLPRIYDSNPNLEVPLINL